MRRLHVSYRVSLAVAIPLLVVATGGFLAIRNYLTTRGAIEALAGDLFAEVSRRTAARTQDLLLEAPRGLDTLAGLSPLAADEPSGELEGRLLATLRAHERLAWVSYGDARGAFTGVYRPTPDSLRVNRSVIAFGRTVLDEHDLDGAGRRLFRHEDDTGYDPRTREWYRAAARSRGRAWTSPYVFFGQGVPGITCARAQLGPQGNLLGVYTADFDLRTLSAFVRSLSLSPGGAVFVLTPERRLIAHPRLPQLGRGEELLTLEASSDPRLRAFDRALAAQDFLAPAVAGGGLDERFRLMRVDVEGVPHFASVTSFAVDGELRWAVGAIAPERDFLGAIEDDNRVSLWIALGALVLAVLVAVALAGRVSRPLERIAGEMEAVGRFELERPALPESSFFREIALMQRALGSMKNGLRSFASFVPRDVVRAMLASGQKAELGGQVRELTLFFSDLAGFTTLAESLEPSELVQRLGRYLEVMTRTLGEGGGTVDKFMGDGIMAFWGAPAGDPRHAEHACRTALACQRALARLANEPGLAWVGETVTRIGLATGHAIVGNVGTSERMNYTAMGDTVNLASRLESLNKQYGTRVMAEEGVVREAGDALIARPIDVVAVKGKARGVKVYELLAFDGDEGAERAREIAHTAEQALEAYLARDMRSAIVKWRALLELVPNDAAAAAMIERAEGYLASPPPGDWTGVHVATSK